MPPDPLKGPILGRKYFLLLALWSEASTEGILSNKCLLLVEYKQFQRRRTNGITHCIGNRQVNYLFTGNKNFIKLGFHNIHSIRRGLAQLFGVCDFGWEKIFSKILIWTIVRG